MAMPPVTPRSCGSQTLSGEPEDAPLTISFGISTFPTHGQSADGLLRTADQALYAAKRLGRNRSVIASAEVPGILTRSSRATTDGAGYPEGRGADDVPIESAILAVADAYEAMTSERPYRPALPPDEAANELRRGAGHQFRADVVDALLRAV